MHRPSSALISTGLIGSGALLCAWIGGSLLANSELKAPLNPFGINHSPYGEVFAMAMQGPINTNFHVGMYGASPQQLAQQQKKSKPGSLLIVKPDPEEASTEKTKPRPWSLSNFLQATIIGMQRGHVERTNPLPASQALKFFLRRSAEDKLRLAYDLDPSHYANYATLHFFLIEGIGTRPELTPSAAKLAQETIDYCLKQKDDPRPALTAAAACTNILHLMFTDHRKGGSKYTPDQMLGVIAKLDECLEKYHSIAQDWDANDSWKRLSPQRIDECMTRIDFISKIRDASYKTISVIQKSQMSQKQS